MRSNSFLTYQARNPCSSIHRFKGLEQRVVLVAELDAEFAARPQRERDALCYVAFSRPRSHLVLLGSETVLSELPR